MRVRRVLKETYPAAMLVVVLMTWALAGGSEPEWAGPPLGVGEGEDVSATACWEFGQNPRQACETAPDDRLTALPDGMRPYKTGLSRSSTVITKN